MQYKESFSATPTPIKARDTCWTPRSNAEGDIWKSQENINENIVDQDVLDLYNQSMTSLASEICQEFSPLQSRTKTTWDDTSVTIKKEVQENVLQGCQIVCKVAAPNSSKEVFDSLFKVTETDSISEELVSLMTAYRDAPSKNVKLQILSIYASRFPAEKLIKYHEPYENITHWQIKQARSHARKYGPGVPEEKTLRHRVRLPMDKADHFIDFVDRPYFYQDVAYGTRVLKLDSGLEVSMPNVVRTVTRSTMVHQYLQYCNEEEFTPLCQRTLFKILEVREASQRKSLQGLDNTAADGAVGFESLEKIVDDLKTLGASNTWCCETKKLLNECKRYLKTDYRVHCRESHSSCPDHCRDYALSDEKEEAFSVTCNHTHDVLCDQCESLNSVLKDIGEQIKSTSLSFYSDDQQKDLLHDWKNSKESIYNWKSHILRSITQESAKQSILQKLEPTEALIIFDWAMKFQQMKFREKQSDWFGKRGLSWHISTIVLKPEKSKDVEVTTYAHLFDKCTQDWYAVVSIIEDLLGWLKSYIPSVSQVYLRSDEAGCYHNNFLVAALHDISERTGIVIKRYDHSEPQDGKDMCDRILCPMKTAVRTFCNEGHDITSANDIRTALLERPVKGVSAAVCSVQESNKTLKVKKMDGFSKYHNFAFEADGVRIWKCYGIGSGSLVPYESLTRVSQGPTALQVEQPFFDISQSRALKPKTENQSAPKESSLNLLCPEPGCEKLFDTFADLELHLDVGDHAKKEGKETASVYDTIRKRWASRFTTVQIERNKSRLEGSSQLETRVQDQGTTSSVTQGWALHKVRGGGTQFSQNVRDYLTSKFDLGEKTGQKCDADQVAKDMRKAKTVENEKMFTRDEWLTKTQIKGFFSRLASSRRKRSRNASTPISAEDEEDEINEQEHYEILEEVLERLGLQHPIVYDVYNLCKYYEDDLLSSFNVSMLRDICRHFEIPFKSRDLKRILVEKVASMIKECSCCASDNL